MGHKIVGLERLDGFMGVAFYSIGQSSNIIVDLGSPRRVFSGETIHLKLTDQLRGGRGVASKEAGRYQGGHFAKAPLPPKNILPKKGLV